MDLADLLDIRPGVTAVIGGGGKTTLLETLGRDLADAGSRVLLCTTTRIFPFPNLENQTGASEETLAASLAERRLLCAGTPVPDSGKLTAPAIPFSRLAALADYVLVEADGSAGRPLKAHASHEPVVPPEAGRVIWVIGASGFGRPVRDAVHRPEIFCQITGLGPEEPVTPEAVAVLLQKEAPAAAPPICVFVNQAETGQTLSAARRLAELLPWPVRAGALKRRRYHAGSHSRGR